MPDRPELPAGRWTSRVQDAEGERLSLTRKVFTKLLGLFVLLLVFHTAVMEIVFQSSFTSPREDRSIASAATPFSRA